VRVEEGNWWNEEGKKEKAKRKRFWATRGPSEKILENEGILINKSIHRQDFMKKAKGGCQRK